MSETQNTPKQQGGPFKKGDARINRGGRPKGYTAFRKGFRDREKTEKLRDEVYQLATQGETGQIRLFAIKLWFEYGWGKAPNAPEDNDAVRESGRVPLTREEALAIARGEVP